MHPTRCKALAIILITTNLFAACSSQNNTTAIPKPVVNTHTATNQGHDDVQALALFETIYEERVALSPVSQTYLGRKTNQDKWNDLSPEQDERYLVLNKAHLKKLKAIDPSTLSPQVALSYTLQKTEIQHWLDDYQWRYYGYPINQMFGTHSHVPSLLINQHSITTVKDAENYIARLHGVPKLFEQLITDLKTRASLGIVPPQFVFEHVIRDCNNLLIGLPFTDSPDKSTLLADFTRKVNDADITEEKMAALLTDATDALKNSVKPAYKTLISYLQQLEQQAPVEGGAWQMPDGEAYYNLLLRRTTTTDLTAEQIHKIGLEEVARIHKEMATIKDTVNFDGDLQAFFNFMRTSPQFTYAESEAGKAQYLSETQTHISTMEAALPTMFNILPKAALKVKAVEPFREKSAGKAFYQSPAPDGSRPGIYYVNLYSLENMPWYQMEALAYHEAVPGHHMQIAIAQELQDMPKFRKFGGYTAYSEGWGLYAEYLAKEMGAYQNPYSDFGRLSWELWRACRLVVDTGLHAKRWTRQQAIDYLQQNTPNPLNDIERAVERYLVMPSQATAYKVGMLKILELRKKAKQALGENFDIRKFHDAVLKNGALPLDVLEQQIELWVETKKSVTLQP